MQSRTTKSIVIGDHTETIMSLRSTHWYARICTYVHGLIKYTHTYMHLVSTADNGCLAKGWLDHIQGITLHQTISP